MKLPEEPRLARMAELFPPHAETLLKARSELRDLAAANRPAFAGFGPAGLGGAGASEHRCPPARRRGAAGGVVHPAGNSAGRFPHRRHGCRRLIGNRYVSQRSAQHRRARHWRPARRRCRSPATTLPTSATPIIPGKLPSPPTPRRSRFLPGVYIGTGVDLSAIQRQVDESLNSRLNSAMSDNSRPPPPPKTGAARSKPSSMPWATRASIRSSALSPAIGRNLPTIRRTSRSGRWSSRMANPSRSNSTASSSQLQTIQTNHWKPAHFARHQRHPACAADRGR